MIQKIFLLIATTFLCGWITIQAAQAQSRPLETGCNSGTQLDYENPVSCVIGYVYFDGQPIADATVVVTAPNGEQKNLTTYRLTDAEHPSFSISLEQSPLNVKLSETITITASYDGQAKTDIFVAREGTRQIDIVLPMHRTDSVWVNAHLSARYGHAMVYDIARRQMFLFGGYTAKGDYLGDTWIRTDGMWIQQVPPNNPNPRHGHTLVYDDTHNQVLLFGGQNAEGAYLNDLWAWDGTDWKQLLPTDESVDGTPNSPPARTQHGAAYHTATQQLVLFGGYNGGGALEDTWLWDDSGWQQATVNESQNSTSPPKRLRHGMAYHRDQQVVMLFGGSSDFTDSASLFNDSWTWDGAGWQRIETATQPPPSADHRMAYVADQQQVILLGGGLQNALWFWSDEGWILQDMDHKLRVRSHHAMAYDEQLEQIVIFGGQYNNFLGTGDLADTWHGDTRNLPDAWQQVNHPPIFTQWQDVAMAYEQNGNALIFGGLAGTTLQGIPQSDTFHWQESTWEQLTPEHRPPARYAHRLAGTADGQRILLFGGIGTGRQYLNDTWSWQEQDWISQTPRETPPTRAYHTMTYDSWRGEWLLFGGQDEEGMLLNDLWAYNGTEWKIRNTLRLPAARAQATFVYDVENQEALLFAGRGTDNIYLNDLWAWNGISWQKRVTSSQPPPRAGHGATYDPIRKRMVISGGRTEVEHLDDTWTWNGRDWRRQQARPPLPTTYLSSLDYDPLNDQLIGFGEQIGGNRLGEGLLIHRTLSGAFDTEPIATISYVNPKDVRQSEPIYFEGRGGDGDGSDIISAHRWTHDGQVISTQHTFSITANLLPLGTQQIQYDVQDDEGNWSKKITQQVYIRDQVGGTNVSDQAATWTLLVYAAGDNDLAPWLGDDPFRKGMLYRLQRAGRQERVQVGVLYDGDGEDDTYHYILGTDGRLQEESIAEADMGDAANLQAFIEWGYETFDSDYYALHIASHANGIIGIALDEHDSQGTTTSSFLTPFELRSSLQLATQSGSRRLEVIHFDGCSFGLLENAALVDGLAHYAVASPNTALGFFTYEIYRQLAATASTPQAYAQAVAEHYASVTTAAGTAHTISVFNMNYFSEVRQAVDDLGSQLLAYVRSDIGNLPEQIAELRTQERVQKYDSGGITDFDIDDEDEYVDLGAWAQVIAAELADEDDLSAAARQVTASLTRFIDYEHHASGQILAQQAGAYDIDLEGSHGIGIYYPKSTTSANNSAYTAYQENKLFHITKGWGWTNFLAFGIPALGSTNRPLTENLLAPMIPMINATSNYLPVIMR